MATSICTQEEYIVPDRAKIGDVLILTKPLGTGVAINLHQMVGTERFSKVKLLVTEEEVEKGYRRAVDRWTWTPWRGVIGHLFYRFLGIT